jgi:hypothetical protein
MPGRCDHLLDGCDHQIGPRSRNIVTAVQGGDHDAI